MRLDCLLLFMSLTMLWACNQEQVLPNTDSVERIAAVCDIPGVFKQHECGLIITLEDGSRVYATSYPNSFKPEAGMAVKLAYTRLVVTDDTQQSSSSGDSNSCEDGDCGTSSQNDGAEMSCMERSGVVPILIQCITDKNS